MRARTSCDATSKTSTVSSCGEDKWLCNEMPFMVVKNENKNGSLCSTTMATFEYVEIPADAIRLKSTSLEPATKILTSLPDTTRMSSGMSRAAAESLSPTKSALALVPQLLLSASIPSPTLPSTASIISSAIATPNPRAPSYSLLSTRDPLSVPIMTANFRRFVSRVGPVFWLQDRVEEIILWKKGWKRTIVFLAAYGFFCTSVSPLSS